MSYPYHEQSWPTIEGYKQKEVVVGHDQIKKLIDGLDQQRRDILKGGKTGKGHPQDLIDTGNEIIPQHVGATGAGAGTPSSSYPAGEIIYQSIKNVHDQFPKAYQKWMESYKEVVNALYVMAGVYTKTEVANQVNSSGTNSDTDPFAGNGTQA